jgi:hypothetical protein
MVLRRVLKEEVWPGEGGNQVGTAVDRAITILQHQPGKRVIVVVGDDRPESCELEDPCVRDDRARSRALEEEVVIHGVRIGTRPTQITAYPVERMADVTGGGYMRLDERAGLESTMKAVAEELRHEYLIGFKPNIRDNRSHAVTVQVTRPGLVTRARRTFRLEGK